MGKGTLRLSMLLPPGWERPTRPLPIDLPKVPDPPSARTQGCEDGDTAAKKEAAAAFIKCVLGHYSLWTASRFISDVTQAGRESFPFQWQKDWLSWTWGNLLMVRQPIRTL